MGLSKQISDTFSHGIVYGIGQTAVELVSFMLIPLYTRYLSPSDYGVLALLDICAAMAVMILGLGLYSALFASYYDDTTDSQLTIVSTTFYILVTGTSVCMLVSLTAPFLASAIFGTREYSRHLSIIFFTAGFDIISGLPLAIYRVKKWSKKYGIVNLSFIVIRLLLIIYLVAFLRRTVWGAVMGNFLASVIRAGVLYSTVWKHIGKRFSYAEARRLLAFGLPLVPASLGSLVLNMGNRFFLNYYCTLSEVGIYNLGHKFGVIVRVILVTPFKLIWLPLLFSIKTEPYAKEYYSRILTYFLCIATFIALGVAVFSREVIQIVAAEEFWVAYTIVPVIALSYVVWGMREVFSVGILLERKTQYFIIGVAAGAFSGITLNFLLVPKYGMMGAAAAGFISFAVMCGVTYAISWSLHKIAYEWGRIAKLLAVSFIIYFAASNLVMGNLLLSLVLKGLLCASYPVILFAIGFLDDKEKCKCAQLWKQAGLVFAGRIHKDARKDV